MFDLFTQARHPGDVKELVVCPEIRVRAAVPFGFHVRWFREDALLGPAGATGLLLPPRSAAWLDVKLRGDFALSLVSVDGVDRLRIESRPGAGEQLTIAVNGTLLDGGGAAALEHALAGSHPVDRIRRLLPMSGSEDWRWLHESCSVPASYLESLQEALCAIPVAIEGLLWECARDPQALHDLMRWISLACSWKSADEAAAEIGPALETDASFAGSPAFALIDSLGLLHSARLPLEPGLLKALRAIVFHPGHGSMLLRLHSLARRSRLRLRGSVDSAPWRQQAERLTELSASAVARAVEATLGAGGEGGIWMADAVCDDSAEARRTFDGAQRDRSLALGASAPWTLSGPLAWNLLRRRTVSVSLPWLPAPEAGILTRRCQQADISLDGPGQVRVLLPVVDRKSRWGQWAAEVLSGPFSRHDGLAQGGPDRLAWSATYHIEPGPLPRFLARLLEDYRFSRIPEITQPAELSFDISVPREWTEGWAAAPHSRDPEYATIVTRIARTLQWAMRRWVPFVYFLENPDAYSSRTAMPILIYAASVPRAIKKKREFGYEVIDKGLVAQAIRSASPRLQGVYHAFDPDRRTLENRYRSVLKSNSVATALNYVWRFPRQFEQLLQFDLFLIEQSIHFIEVARKVNAALFQPPGAVSKLFQSEVDAMARSVRNRLQRNLPADLDDYVPLLFIQAISALHGNGLGADIPAATVTIRQGGWSRLFRNTPDTIQDELSFDGLSIPAACA